MNIGNDAKFDPSKYKQAFLFNNAGTFGPGNDLKGISNFKALRQTVDLNVTSPMILTSLFVSHFAHPTSGQSPQCFVINISSLAAIQASQGWVRRSLLHAANANQQGNLLCPESCQRNDAQRLGPGRGSNGFRLSDSL